MDKIRIAGGKTLEGSVRVSGAKNSTLPLLFSTLLANGEHRFQNVPELKDVDSTFQLLETLGARSILENHVATIGVSDVTSFEAHYDLVRKMRASILCLGPLMGRYGRARVSLPGGCAIGARPINLHLDALEKMGAKIKLEGGYVEAECKKLRGTTIMFDTVTVTGTENVLMAAVLAEGETILENAAKEPEVTDLVQYLARMGAKIEGIGTSILKIKGVTSLKPSTHTVIADRIEAGTLLLAGAITGGDVLVEGCAPVTIEHLILKLREAGFRIEEGPNHVRIRPTSRWYGVDMTTAPFPGFATDLQAQFMAVLCHAQGTSIVTETIFENRFMHVQELIRMGADISAQMRVAIVRGKPGCLQGAPVMATDLRASASLVLAGLVARGETVVSRIYHLDRGYERLEEKLRSLGADIERVS